MKVRLTTFSLSGPAPLLKVRPVIHELYSSFARPELRSYVRAFAQRRIDPASAEVVEPIPASLEQILDFEFKDSPIVSFGDGRRITAYSVSMVGPSAYLPANLHLPGGVESFAIFFQPLAFSQLFRIPMSILVNRQYDGCDVLGREIRQLWHKMAESTSFPERVKLAEEYLLEKAASRLANTFVVDAAMHMFARRGSVRISGIASQCSLGMRQFERRFSKEIGLSPKLYSRVARFQAVLDAKITCPNNCWLNLVYEFGYFDQAHLVKDFQDLSGLSPESLLLRLGDMRPPALAAGNQVAETHSVHFPR